MVGAISSPILDALDIRFELLGNGSATCYLRAAEWQHSIECFSDCYEDTFRDFLLAAVADDAGSFQSACVAFEFEPGHALMELSAQYDAATATPYALVSARDHPHGFYQAAPDADAGMRLFEVRVKQGVFAQAVSKAFIEFADEPETRFEPNWGFPFPAKAHSALMASLATENRTRREPEGPFGTLVARPGEDHD